MSEQQNIPAWVGITYLIYCAIWLALTIGGAGYAVFCRGYSGWWILAGIILASMGFKPPHWRALWTGDYPGDKEGDL